eukprot:354175-Chlamydomonas_euryale.AAC.7
MSGSFIRGSTALAWVAWVGGAAMTEASSSSCSTWCSRFTADRPRLRPPTSSTCAPKPSTLPSPCPAAPCHLPRRSCVAGRVPPQAWAAPAHTHACQGWRQNSAVFKHM